MSSRFISAGSIDATTGTPSSSEPTLTTTSSTTTNDSSSSKKSKEWAEVTQQLEADRQRRLAQAKREQEGGEKSLYEVLQANKAAKQAEIEEKTKLRNQFRALDEDEVDFLDEVKRRKREEEMERKKELEQGLAMFKELKGQSDGEGEGLEGLEEEWAFTADSGRRRKKRRGMGGGEEGVEEGGRMTPEVKAAVVSPPKPAAAAPAAAPVKKPGGGLLVDYGSDSDD
ncbi:N-terminal domain of NEFA-interacting nuclear protein NIP30-domain-containing protein [Apiosordaria backusii]|uniref:N-terminal domain of NEFA-interacting nuclear protein NIP30-domain-containing protein n=1 Tax=Apiosordaria backusii TaxID=314023 RepID=A0AA40E3G5_9PEZI|nr:N-terminal domain of NEFA-interacting nuclear protein NIP30-domain-containing protein [Apiosordaria backusii]